MKMGNNPKKTPELLKKALALRDEGLSYQAICEEIGIKSKGTLSKWFATAEDFLFNADLPLPIKVDTSKPDLIGEILSLCHKVDQKVSYYERRFKQAKNISDKERYEKWLNIYTKEKRLLLQFGRDTEYQLRQFGEVKHTLFIILEEIKSEGPEIANRIIQRLKKIRNSGFPGL
jgi:orotate phosphoribosyltransferase-like protein